MVEMCIDLTLWEEAVKFHGHTCPGLAMGVRASIAALQKLGIERAKDEELAAFVYTDGCGVDGVQVITGCTLGKGNLFFRDYGKQAYIIARRDGSCAIRVVFNPYSNFNEEDIALRKRCFGGQATMEEMKKFREQQQQYTQHILYGSEEEVLSIREVNIEIPQKALIFDSIRCEKCGEYFMEPRARIQQGQVVCLDCFDEYKRYQI